MKKLFVLYDDDCGLCDSMRDWMLRQKTSVEIELIASGSERARAMFPNIESKDELVAITDEGEIHRGDGAFILCLHVLDAHRSWASRLSTPGLRPLAKLAFEMLSKNRKRISDLLALASDEIIAHELKRRAEGDKEVPLW